MKPGTLTVLAGLPGSGKSTLAKGLPGVRVAPDKYLAELGKGQDPTPADNLAAQSVALAEAVERLSAGEDVIYDHINLTPEVRARVWSALRKAELKPTVIAKYLRTDLATCIGRNTGREFDLSPLNIFYLALTATVPTRSEGYDRVEVLEAKAPPAPKGKMLTAWLENPTQIPNAEGLKSEVLALELYAAALAKLGENWADELVANHAALVESCTENEIKLTPELATAWLLKDLFRIVTEYFAAQHPEGDLAPNTNLNGLIYDRILKPELAPYGLNLKDLKLLLAGYYAAAELGQNPPKGATTRLLSALLVS